MIGTQIAFNAAKKKYARDFEAFVSVRAQGKPDRVSTLSYLNRPEKNWVDERRHTHTDRPAKDTKSISLRTHLAGKDLSWQQESDSAPGGCIYQIEHEQHGHCRRRELRCPG
jgi:hypothetical protein